MPTFAAATVYASVSSWPNGKLQNPQSQTNSERKSLLLQPHNHTLPVLPSIVLSTLFMQRAAYTRPPSSAASLLRNPKPRPKKSQTFQHCQNLQLQQRAGRAKGNLHTEMRSYGETGSRTQNLLHSTCTLLYDAKKMSYR
jgi:hypothetical protein